MSRSFTPTTLVSWSSGRRVASEAGIRSHRPPRHPCSKDSTASWMFSRPRTCSTAGGSSGTCGLCALYLDIDAGPHLDPAATLELALSVLQHSQIPGPTLCVFSGRGVHLYWLIHPVPAEVLPRWQACQRRLQQLVRSDPKSLDCTRVLRLVGSRNPKAVPERQTVTGIQLSVGRYHFDWLADQVLPLTRAEVHDLRAERVRSRHRLHW